MTPMSGDAIKRRGASEVRQRKDGTEWRIWSQTLSCYNLYDEPNTNVQNTGLSTLTGLTGVVYCADKSPSTDKSQRCQGLKDQSKTLYIALVRQIPRRCCVFRRNITLAAKCSSSTPYGVYVVEWKSSMKCVGTID